MNDFSSASPKVMAPRQRLETLTPEAPRFLYFIVVNPRVEPITGGTAPCVLGPVSSRRARQPSAAPTLRGGTRPARQRSVPTLRARRVADPRFVTGHDRTEVDVHGGGPGRDSETTSVRQRSAPFPVRPPPQELEAARPPRARSSRPAIAPTEPVQVVLAPGGRVGKYELRERLGMGTFGLVFTAHDLELDRDVAFKVLNPTHATNRDVVQRFLQEARASARIHHPGIVTVFDSGRIPAATGDTAFITMELLQGESLSSRLNRTGR